MRRLRDLERAQDHALALSGEVVAALIAAQRETGLAPSVTQQALEALRTAGAHMCDGRGSTIEGHKALEAIARLFQIEYDEDYGDGIKYPPSRRRFSAAA